MIGDFLVYAFGLLAQKARDKARDEGIAKGAGLVPEERISHLNYQLACATTHRDAYLKALQELSGIADSVVTSHHVDAIRKRMETAEKERDEARAALAAIKEEPEPYLKASYEHDLRKARASCEAAEKERDALLAELEAVKARAKIATQAAVECLGSVGPESVDAAMGRMVAEVDRLKNDRTRVQANQERLVRRYKRDGAPRVGDMVLTAGGFLYDVTDSSAGGPRCSEDGQDIGWLRSVDVVATLAPPPQAAPVPPVGVGDVWGEEAVRVVHIEEDDQYEVHVGDTLVRWFNSRSDADEEVRLIRRGLASLPPLRAVLVGGVTEGMAAAFSDAWHGAFYGRCQSRRESQLAGLTAAFAVSPIRVLGPGDGVVRVRVLKSGEKEHAACVFRTDDHGWTGAPCGVWSARGDVTRYIRYILAADLDAAALALTIVGDHDS